MAISDNSVQNIMLEVFEVSEGWKASVEDIMLARELFKAYESTTIERQINVLMERARIDSKTERLMTKGFLVLGCMYFIEEKDALECLQKNGVECESFEDAFNMSERGEIDTTLYTEWSDVDIVLPHDAYIQGFIDYLKDAVDESIVEDVIRTLGGDEYFCGFINIKRQEVGKPNVASSKMYYGDDAKALRLYERHPINMSNAFANMANLYSLPYLIANKIYFAGEDCGVSDADLKEMVHSQVVGSTRNRAMLCTRFVIHLLSQAYNLYYERVLAEDLYEVMLD